MSVIAIPNVSEGRDLRLIEELAASVSAAGARILDTHTDGRHNRSVFTVAGSSETLVDAMVGLAGACARLLDLRTHEGIHPRFGSLDVCPFVPLEPAGITTEAAAVAEQTAERIAEEHGLPVYLYGDAARRPRFLELPSLRKALKEESIEPDLGPSDVDPRCGVVCVGARPPLIAFNVWIKAPRSEAVAIAAATRESSSGLRGVRALGLAIDDDTSQVSMNLTAPRVAGIDRVYGYVASLCAQRGTAIAGTEIVGLVPERFAPDPGKEATRRSISPGRVLETVLAQS